MSEPPPKCTCADPRYINDVDCPEHGTYAYGYAAGYEQGARRHALEIAAIVEQWYDGSRNPTNALQRIDDLCSVPIRALDPAPVQTEHKGG